MTYRGKVLTLFTLLIISNLSTYKTPYIFSKVLTSLVINNLSAYTIVNGAATLQLASPDAAEPEGKEAENAKGTINQTPPQRNPAKAAKNECIGNDQGAGYQAEIEQPAVTDGVAQGANKGDGDYKMPERQPVCAVKKEWILGLGLSEGGVDAG